MDWRKYEQEIYESYGRFFPDAKISFNRKILGRYSKTERQIDVLIEGRIAGKNIRLIIDGKYYKKNIDVKEVESFLGMVKDVDAVQGILMTSKGYSRAAINRAYYDPDDIELDVLSLGELKRHQGEVAQFYSGWYGAITPAPFGWIADGTSRVGSIATFYQRGKTFEEAVESEEFMYANIFPYGSKGITKLEDVLEYHENETKFHHPTATFEYHESIEREDGCKTVLRKIIREETHLHEYSGFISFEKYCVFFVLLTPKELSAKNVRKLEYIVESTLPMHVDLPSVAQANISTLEQMLEGAETSEDRGNILWNMGQIYRLDLNEKDQARQKYEESSAIFPDNVASRLSLLEMDFDTDSRDLLLEEVYNFSPSSLGLCSSLIEIFVENESADLLEAFFLRKTKEHSGDYEKIGNLFVSLGGLRISVDDEAKAIDYFKQAKESYLKAFDDDHHLVNETRRMIRELSNT